MRSRALFPATRPHHRTGTRPHAVIPRFDGIVSTWEFCDFKYNYKQIMYTNPNTYLDPTLEQCRVSNLAQG